MLLEHSNQYKYCATIKIKQVVGIAIDPSQMLSLVSNLPSILNTVQWVTYVFLVLFLGSVAIVGFRIYTTFGRRMLLRIVFGIFSLVSGIALRSFMPLPDFFLIKMLQLDMLFAGFVLSIVFAVSLFLLSRSMSAEKTLKRQIEKLGEMLKKEKSRKMPGNPAKSPYFFAGMLIIVVVLGFAAINFRGMPSMMDNILSSLGISQSDFDSLKGLAGAGGTGLPGDMASMPEGCVSVLAAISSHQDDLTGLLSDYEDQQLKARIEQGAGESVAMMKRADIEGTGVVLAITSSGKACIATSQDLCMCKSQ